MTNFPLNIFYSNLPVYMQNIACSLVGLKIRHERYNKVFRKTLKFLRQSQWWSFEDQKAYQDEKLRFIIEHAYQTVPYYREIFEAVKLTPGDIRSTEDLCKLPILDKKTVRKRFADLQSKGWPKNRIRYGHTAGTTGTALQLASDIDTQAWQWAVWWRHRERFDLKVYDPYIVFAGKAAVPLNNMNPPVWRRNLPMHQTYITVHHLTSQNLPVVAEYLCKRKVKYYSGYPSAIYLVACYFLDNHIRLPHPPRVIVTGSETLLPHHREVIGKAFNAKVTDQYGAAEHCGNISACEKHTYHVDMEFGIVEFLPMEGMPLNVRQIVCTGLHNMAMPLIRYNIGDIATLSNAVCECGRQAPTVKKIDGRIESYILTPDGRQLGRLGFLFYESSKIEEAQLIQETLSSVTVRLVRSPDYSNLDEKALLDVMRRYLGDQIKIQFEYLDKIPREPNGKFRHIVSHVFRDKYAQPTR